tara:strand:- start:1173 stop:2048 length:876 start_codon:yes stop_codon:yes gene_type:complete
METETLPLLYKDRSYRDREFIREVCTSILSQPFKSKKHDDTFCGIFIDGRKRHINTLEDHASLLSFKTFSEANYPLFCFVFDDTDFLGGATKEDLERLRITIIKIPEITSLEAYTEFCLHDLYPQIPDHIEWCLTLQPDGALLRNGWETFIKDNDLDWCGPHWRHLANIGIFTPSIDLKSLEIISPFPSTQIGNGGFSCRRLNKMRQICEILKTIKCIEIGRADFRPPMEDCQICCLGFGSGIMKKPTLKQADLFACDPLTPEIFKSETSPFGFHFFSQSSEPDWPPCNHA